MTLELEVRAQMIYRRDRELPVLDSREYLDTHWEFATPDWDAAHTRYMIVVRDGMPAGKVLLDAGGSARVPPALLVGAGEDDVRLGVSVVGYGDDGLVITTSPVGVDVYASGYAECGPQVDLPPDVAQQIYQEMDALRERVPAGCVVGIFGTRV